MSVYVVFTTLPSFAFSSPVGSVNFIAVIPVINFGLFTFPVQSVLVWDVPDTYLFNSSSYSFNIFAWFSVAFFVFSLASCALANSPVFVNDCIDIVAKISKIMILITKATSVIPLLFFDFLLNII